MSSAPADLVNAVELAGRSATLERRLVLRHLPRLAEAGALEGTRARAELAFGKFEGRTTVEVQVTGELVLTCQRCLRPCTCTVNDNASLVVMASDAEEVPGGFEPLLGDAAALGHRAGRGTAAAWPAAGAEACNGRALRRDAD